MSNFIAVDIGHGETTSSIVEMVLKDGRTKYLAKTLCFDKSVPTVYSRIFITEEQLAALSTMEKINYEKLSELGSFTIGNFPEQIGRAGEAFQYFKVKPSMLDNRIDQGELTRKYAITFRMIISCFIYQVVNEVFINNPNMLAGYNKKSCSLLVGCPTSPEWTDNNRKKEYAKLVSDATGIKNVIIIPESRAAMFTSIKNHSRIISAASGAIIFDFGSSTADCTYMWMGKKLWEFSWRLGASAIETELYSYLLENYNANNKGNEITPEQIINAAPESVRLLRGSKERFFGESNEAAAFRATLVFDETNDAPARSIVKTVSSAEMEHIVKERIISFNTDNGEIKSGSWYDLCKEFIEYAKEQIGSFKVNNESCPINSIVVTGGASRMSFIKKLCNDEFEDCSRPYIEKNPSYSVSDGLCFVKLCDEKMDECIRNACETVNSNSECSFDSLSAHISKHILQALGTVSKPIVIDWVNNETNQSIQDLINEITIKLNTFESQTLIKNSIYDAYYEWGNACSEIINTQVTMQAKKLFSVDTPDFNSDFADAFKTKLDFDFDNMINSICKNVVASIQQMVIGLLLFVIGLALSACGLLIGIPLIALAGADWTKLPVVKPILKVKNGSFIRMELGKEIISRFDSENEDSKKIFDKIFKNVRQQLADNKDLSDEKLKKNFEEIIADLIEIMMYKKFD